MMSSLTASIDCQRDGLSYTIPQHLVDNTHRTWPWGRHTPIYDLITQWICEYLTAQAFFSCLFGLYGGNAP